MATLHFRHVPDEVAQTLKEPETAEGKSLSAYVGAELAEIATRPTEAQIVSRLATRPILRPHHRRDPRSGPGGPSVIVVDASAMVQALVGRDADGHSLTSSPATSTPPQMPSDQPLREPAPPTLRPSSEAGKIRPAGASKPRVDNRREPEGHCRVQS